MKREAYFCIGDGLSIKVILDPWVLEIFERKTLLVAYLRDKEPEIWNTNLLRSFFQNEIGKAIANIRWPRRNGKDRLC